MSATTRNRVAVLHGVNFDVLERRDPAFYGGKSLNQLESQIGNWAHEYRLEPMFFQSNHEGEFVEQLHGLDGLADAIILNPGAWTHYAWSLRDALEIADLPAVEVHLSDVNNREEFRRTSVIRDLCVATVSGRGPDGYREALTVLKQELGE